MELIFCGKRDARALLVLNKYCPYFCKFVGYVLIKQTVIATQMWTLARVKGKVPLGNIAKRFAAYKPKERAATEYIPHIRKGKMGFGLPICDAPNAVEELKQPEKHPAAEK